MGTLIRNAGPTVVAVLMLSLGLPTVSEADDWEPLVIKVSSTENAAGGELVVTLTSGAKVTINKKDILPEWTDAVAKSIQSQNAEQAVRSSSEPPNTAQGMVVVRAFCRQEWGDDFRMRKYCEDKQREALMSLRARTMSGVLAKVRARCASEWPNDFKMRDYCETKQIEALRQLQ